MLSFDVEAEMVLQLPEGLAAAFGALATCSSHLRFVLAVGAEKLQVIPPSVSSCTSKAAGRLSAGATDAEVDQSARTRRSGGR